jgi:Icc-related predicted phosphoesterase
MNSAERTKLYAQLPGATSFATDEAKTVFAGDWHGNEQWLNIVIPLLASEGVETIYQVGDFGLFPGPGGKRFLMTVSDLLEKYNINLFVIPGNHDNYAHIAMMKPNKEGWLKLSNKTYERISFAPRGHTWLHDGYRFAALGGAGSIDRAFREEGISWWPGEEILPEDCSTLIANVAKQGWDRVDVLITHESPAGITMKGMVPKPRWLTPEIEHYCWTQRVRMREAVDVIMPKLNIHGHWHELSDKVLEGVSPTGVEYSTRVVGLHMEGPANIWSPDLSLL